MYKNILITGGAGFIGSNLSLKLLEKRYIVTVLDNLSKQVHGENTKSHLYEEIKGKVNFIHGDICNKDDWRKALKGQDVVIHFAAETGTGQSMYKIQKYVDVNVNGTAIFLDILANERHTIKKIIVASSRAIYGEGKYICQEHGEVYPEERNDIDLAVNDYEPKCPFCSGVVEIVATDENAIIHPTSIYGITKQTQEQMVLCVGRTLNIPSVALRYQNVYGPGQSLINPYTGILSIFSTQIRNGNDLNIFEDGQESRDFVYIDDAIEATILGLEKRNADFEVFNVGSGYQTTVLTVAMTLKDLYSSSIDIHVSGNYRIGDIRHNFADLTKISKKIGFYPRYTFREGMSEFVKWVLSQEIEKDTYDSSIDKMKAKGLYK